MKSKITWIFTLCLAFFIQFSFAQEKVVSGTVVSKTDNMSMPGVSVVVQGTTRGVQTDFDGKYSIKVAAGQKLVFSFLGSKTQVIPVGASNVINVQLADESQQLGEVVVEGYNITRTKAKSNVASVTVSAKTLEGRPNATFIQSLQSQVAGLNIATGSGQPGANSSVILRGVGSLTGQVEPLYVIDNVPMSTDNFKSLNPDEIESVSVLKDGGATAIYGSRAANGVIVIKTKKGGYDASLKVSYSASTGFSTVQKNKYDLMNTQQLLTLERAKGVGVGAGLNPFSGTYGAPYSDEEIALLASQRNTDWTKQFLRTGVTQNHVLALTSGSKNMTSFTSLGYFSQDGIVKETGMKRFSFRSNLDGKSKNEKFTYSTNLSVNFSRNQSAFGVGGASVAVNPLFAAYQAVPYLVPGDYKGSAELIAQYQKFGSLMYTPLFIMDNMAGENLVNGTDELKGIASLAAGYKLAKDWTVGTNFGLDYTQTDGFSYLAPETFNAYLIQRSSNYLGFENHTYSRDIAFNWNNRLNYNKTFAQKHNVDVTFFTEYWKSHANNFGMSQNGLDPKTDSPGAGTGYLPTVPQNGPDLYVPDVNAGKASTGLFSYFATADYDFDGRFGFGASIRRDASSRFAESNRWGTFYSFTGRWNIDREKFMEGSVFNALKLRASYGTNGNQNISGSTYGALNATRELYDVGSGYLGAPSYGVTQLANPDLKWETSIQGNIGLDFELMKSRLRGSFDVYNKETVDLYQPIGLSAINATTSIYANFGSMYNRGVEANLAYDLFKNRNGFNLTLRANGSYNKNRITDVPNELGLVDNGGTVNAEGHRINEFYMVRYIGVNPANGNMLFLDKEGNPTENPDPTADRVFTGKSALPAYQGGFGFDADYKGFFLTTQFSWIADVYRVDNDLRGYQLTTNIGQFNVSNDLTRAWTTVGQKTDIPSLKLTNASADTGSDRYLRDASYLRMKLAQFGYAFPKTMLKKTPFSSLKAYVNAENMVTWTKWRGADVERTGSSSQNGYPAPKIVSLGLQLQF